MISTVGEPENVEANSFPSIEVIKVCCPKRFLWFTVASRYLRFLKMPTKNIMIMLTTIIFCLTENSKTCASIVSGILYKRLFEIAGGGCPINSLQDGLVKSSVSINYVPKCHFWSIANWNASCNIIKPTLIGTISYFPNSQSLHRLTAIIHGNKTTLKCF